MARRYHGEGSIEKRGRRWRAVLHGKRGSQTFDSKAEVVAWLQANAKRPTASAMTVSDWLDIWHADISRRVSTGTAIQYEIHCRLHIRPGIGHVRLASLTPVCPQRRRRKSRPPSERHYKPLSSRVPRPKTSRRRLASRASRSVLTSVGVGFWPTLWRLAIDSGCRQGELPALRRSDFVLRASG